MNEKQQDAVTEFTKIADEQQKVLSDLMSQRNVAAGPIRDAIEKYKNAACQALELFPPANEQ